MIQNTILKVLSTLSTTGVDFILIGGQACIIYGGSEFSRDTDVVIMPSKTNFDKLKEALDLLCANPIALPPLLPELLERGHATHFRCGKDEFGRTRLDIMSKMRNVENFDIIKKRAELRLLDGVPVRIISIHDLIRSKKTQRNKDWLMIDNLLGSHYHANKQNPSREHVELWLDEMRDPKVLWSVTAQFPDLADKKKASRHLLKHAIDGSQEKLRLAITEEENSEREKDRKYWKPLLQEIETMKHEFLRQKKSVASAEENNRINL